MLDLFPKFHYDLATYFFLGFCAITAIHLLFVLLTYTRVAFHKVKPELHSDAQVPVSIIIAARNESQNLFENLPFLLEQDYPEFEIIVINHQDRLHRVIVRSVNDLNTNIMVGDNELVVSTNELLSRWTGSGVLLWRPSEVGTELRRVGDTGNKIINLRGYLNRVLNKVQLPLLRSVDLNEFDADMSQKVFALQTQFGIAGDSRIGDQTYLLMNEIILPSKTPVLAQRISK